MAFTARTETNARGASLTTPFNFTINKAGGVVDGDIMFMFLAVYIATPPTIDSVPDGWGLVATNATSNSRWYLYWKKASSEGASYTWSLTGSCRYYALNIAYSSGDFDVESIADITAISNTLYGTAGTTVRAASMSVPAANSPLVYFAAIYNTTVRTFTPPTAPTTDWVEDADEGHNTPDISVTNGSMIWTGSGATGAMDVICSITITTEKHAFAIALKPAATLTVLTVADGLHSHITDSIAVTQAHALMVAEAIHSHTVESPVLNVLTTFVVTDANHSLSSDNVDIIRHLLLSVADAVHAHGTDTIQLVQVHSLVVAEAIHTYSVEAVELIQVHILSAQDVSHSHTTDSIEVHLQVALTAQDGTHSTTLEEVVLSQLHNLQTQGISHPQSTNVIILVQVHTVLIQDASHSHIVEVPTLEQSHILPTAEQLSAVGAVHIHSVEEPTIVQVHALSIQDALHAVSSDIILLQSEYNLVVQDALHFVISDEVLLISSIELLVEDVTHEHTCDTADLEQIRILTTEECIYFLFSDNIALIGGTSPFYTNFREGAPNRMSNPIVGGVDSRALIYCRPCIERLKLPWSRFKLITKNRTYGKRYNCVECGYKLSKKKNLKRIGGT